MSGLSPEDDPRFNPKLPLPSDVARARARMPADAPERCLHEEHRWTEWTLWVPIMPTVQATLSDDPPPSTEIEAYRDRTCRRCRCVERQSYDGKVIVTEDPHGIARRLGSRMTA